MACMIEGKSSHGHQHPGQAENEVGVLCSTSVVPVWWWRLGNFIGSCWSWAHVESSRNWSWSLDVWRTATVTAATGTDTFASQKLRQAGKQSRFVPPRSRVSHQKVPSFHPWEGSLPLTYSLLEMPSQIDSAVCLLADSGSHRVDNQD